MKYAATYDGNKRVNTLESFQMDYVIASEWRHANFYISLATLLLIQKLDQAKDKENILALRYWWHIKKSEYQI